MSEGEDVIQASRG